MFFYYRISDVPLKPRPIDALFFVLYFRACLLHISMATVSFSRKSHENNLPYSRIHGYSCSGDPLWFLTRKHSESVSRFRADGRHRRLGYPGGLCTSSGTPEYGISSATVFDPVLPHGPITQGWYIRKVGVHRFRTVNRADRERNSVRTIFPCVYIIISYIYIYYFYFFYARGPAIFYDTYIHIFILRTP